MLIMSNIIRTKNQLSIRSVITETMAAFWKKYPEKKMRSLSRLVNNFNFLSFFVCCSAILKCNGKRQGIRLARIFANHVGGGGRRNSGAGGDSFGSASRLANGRGRTFRAGRTSRSLNSNLILQN